jgi:hypothetical protein
MLRDYELALSNYRLLAIDYKLDKAWKRFAGVQVQVFFFDSFCRTFSIDIHSSSLFSVFEFVVKAQLGLLF